MPVVGLPFRVRRLHGETTSQPGAILTPCAMNLHAGSMVQPVPYENPGCEEVFGWEIMIFTKDLKFPNMVVYWFLWRTCFLIWWFMKKYVLFKLFVIWWFFKICNRWLFQLFHGVFWGPILMDHMSISIYETDQAIIELFKGFGHFSRCHTNVHSWYRCCCGWNDLTGHDSAIRHGVSTL